MTDSAQPDKGANPDIAKNGEHATVACEGAILTDASGTITSLNQAAAKFLGGRAEDFIGKHYQELPGKISQVGALTFNKALQLRLSSSFQEPTDDGVLEYRIHPIFDACENTVGAAVLIHDITENIKPRQWLLASKEKLQYVIDNTWDWIFQTDLHGTCTFASKSSERITGYRPEELEGMIISDLLTSEFGREMMLRIQKRIAGEPIEPLWEVDLIRKDGRKVCLELTITSIYSNAALIGIQAVARDVTDRKEARQRIQHQLHMLQTLLDAIPAPIFYMDLQGKYLGCNNAFNQDVLGLPRYTVIGKTMRDVAPKDVAEKCEQTSAQLLQTGGTQEYECAMRYAGGKEHNVICYKALFNDPDGKPAGIVGTMLDITERKRMEEALQAAHRQLIVAREAERHHLAGELHDSLGQKIVAMHLSLKKLQSLCKNYDGKTTEHLFSQISENAAGLAKDVRNICHGLYPPTLEQFGLASSLKNLSAEFGDHATVAIRCGKAAEKKRFPAEVEIELFRIAQEAVCNALRHGKAKQINLSLNLTSKIFSLSITDDGAGFDLASAKNTGLGLCTMKQRAEAIGGKFQIESQPGKTQIRITIPVESPKKSVSKN